MENIQFSVSAKMARLIGRENISDVDSAVIELIKNAYDADANCVFVSFNMPFPSIPEQISFELATSVFGEHSTAPLFAYYERGEKALIKKASLSNNEEKELEQLLFSQNTIIIVDNGHGMDRSTLRMAWMNIGTNDKEERKISPKGRVKTGAKGIGRFALDKLSTKTTIYTKNADDTVLKWHINWNQFETASLLDEVNATLESQDAVFKSLVRRLAGTRIRSFDEYEWDTGTIIKLNPTREQWSTAYFEKVNKNLRSLFPDTNDSQFDIYVSNRFFPKYSFANERFTLKDSEYDYKIAATFDGIDSLEIILHRNEVDTRKIKTDVIVEDVKHELALSDFWNRDAFQKAAYRRTDFAKAISMNFSATDLLKMPSSTLSDVGPFSTELFFLKNTASRVGIIKSIVTARRKETLNQYSGIKIYRDGFKVRPYGEDGSSFDWLGLGVRAQKSPAGVSHGDGSWRVMPYQMIGAVRISRDANPNLTDMANREGLAINDAYVSFVKILDKIVETFEADRQLPYREYASWIKDKKMELSKAAKIVADVSEKEDKKRNEEQRSGSSEKKSSTSGAKYSDKEYENAVSYLEEEKKRQQRANQTMMLFSSAGVMTNTFSHEISRITANMGSRMQHIRESVKRILGEQGYVGDPDFNPFVLIDEAEETDQLLEDWLSIIMEGISGDSFSKAKVYPQQVIQKILNLWSPMLAKKHIYINPLICNNITENSVLDCAEVEIYIIMNNFLLNSAWFLEKSTAERREIMVTLFDENEKIVLLLENNGPPLDSGFANNTDRIFDAGVSTKNAERNEGTGLGLWIVKTIVDNNSGQIHTMEKEFGFGLRVTLPK